MRSSLLVMLSAFETGLSAEGMEYATLTHAFANAGVPAVVATLWEVEDEPSRELMRKFYEYAKGADRFTALAKAQRALLASGAPKVSDPSAWAGYIPFGKP